MKIKKPLVTMAIACMVASPWVLRSGPSIRILRVDAESAFPLITIEADLSAVGGAGDRKEGIAAENLEVFENGFPVKAPVIGTGQDGEGRLCFVFSIDTSRSLSEGLLARLKEAARLLVGTVGEKDRIAVYNFDDEARRSLDFSPAGKEVLTHIEGLGRGGSRTHLYDALYDSITALAREGCAQRSVVVFTDGHDEGSSITENDSIELAREEGIPLSFICAGSGEYGRKMQRIARLTGGRVVFADRSVDLSQVSAILKPAGMNRTRIQYRTGAIADGKMHAIEIRLRHGELFAADKATVPFPAGYWLRLRKIMGSRLFLIILHAAAGIIICCIAVGILVSLRRRRPARAVAPAARERSNPGPASYAGEPDQTGDGEVETVLEDYLFNEEESGYSRAWLVTKNGPEAGKKCKLQREETTIGRERENGIMVQDETASPRHAKIKRTGKEYYLYDLVSARGVFLNGKKLLRPKPLHDWDEIRVGNTTFIFRGSGIGTGAGIDG